MRSSSGLAASGGDGCAGRGESHGRSQPGARLRRLRDRGGLGGFSRRADDQRHTQTRTTFHHIASS